MLDNIRGQFGSAALEAFLTSELYADRVLGASQLVTLPTSVLLMISGNNFHAKGDLYRRLLQARIDPESDAPERRCFNLDPLEYCRANRLALVAAGLTLLRGFVSAGKPRLTGDRLASFEDIGTTSFAKVSCGSPERVLLISATPRPMSTPPRTKTPERQQLAAFLEATAAVMDGEWRVADLISHADGSGMNFARRLV